MGRITIELVRKRSEHNEGDIATLEELSLHEQKLVRIENLDKWCRHLKILLLQNNSITKLENLSRLKCLEYLNLAMNNIEVIEGLEGCESLRKLDLTLNFIGQVSSVGKLKGNTFLEQLYLNGNPCSDYKNYREFVISSVPQLGSLDGFDVSQSERIAARQSLNEIQLNIWKDEAKHDQKREIEKKMHLPNPDDENFWKTPSPDTPEIRALIQQKLEEEELKKTVNKQKVVSKPRRLFDKNSVPFNINEGKYPFTISEDEKEGLITVEIKIPKYMDTSLVGLTIEPTYLRATIKNKIFQVVLPEEVKPDQGLAKRSQTTGYLVISIPKLKWENSKIVTFAPPGEKAISSKTSPLRTSMKAGTKPSDVMERCLDRNMELVDESEVPPLI